MLLSEILILESPNLKPILQSLAKEIQSKPQTLASIGPKIRDAINAAYKLGIEDGRKELDDEYGFNSNF